MEIKDSTGASHDVVGSGWGTYNTIAGSLGLASFLGIGANNAGGLFGGGNQYATKENLQMSIEMAKKDSQIALLQANADTDKKLVEVYNAAAARDNSYRDRLEAQYRELDKKITDEREARMMAESAQGVFNTQVSTGMATINGQIANMQTVLGQITTNVIPSNKVCDTGCSCCNS